MKPETNSSTAVREQIEALRHMTVGQLKEKYREVFGEASRSNHKQFLFRCIAWRVQAIAWGGLSDRARRRAMEIANDADLRIRAPKEFLMGELDVVRTSETRIAPTVDPRVPMPGSLLVRRYHGKDVVIRPRGQIRVRRSRVPVAECGGAKCDGDTLERIHVLQLEASGPEGSVATMSNGGAGAKPVRCAIYTRKSTDEGLGQNFNSLDAQREAAEAFIVSQKQKGWVLVPTLYNDGGYTGANMERPGMKQLLGDIQAGRIDCVVVYKVDRLSRSLRRWGWLAVAAFQQPPPSRPLHLDMTNRKEKGPPTPSTGPQVGSQMSQAFRSPFPYPAPDARSSRYQQSGRPW